MFTAKNRSVKEYYCLEDDTKPTAGVANGSKCFEMDTGDTYYFDEASSTWVKPGASA